MGRSWTKLLPPKIRRRLGNTYRQYRYLFAIGRRLNGTRECQCPMCGFVGRFAGVGHPPRYDAICPNCGSAERHRLQYLAIARLELIAPSLRVLHFAPETCLAQWLRTQPVDYLTADLREGLADIRLDMENIALPDESFDRVIANHVLEHVDDKRAVREIFRILRKGGRLIATVPLIEGWDRTYEDAAIATAAEREVHYGQDDHVRYYGRDFRDRLAGAGFAVTEFTCDGAETIKFGLLRGERVFIGTKA
jgi:SAM-dependent methyltransferase